MLFRSNPPRPGAPAPRGPRGRRQTDRPAQVLRRRRRRQRHRPDHPPRRGGRPPGPQRRRQDHDDRHDPGAEPPHRRGGEHLRDDAAPGGRPGPGHRRHADRRAPARHHRARDGGPDREPLLPAHRRRGGHGARGSRRLRLAAGREVLGGSAPAPALRHGAGERPGPAHPRRADHRHGRRGAPQLLGGHPRRRRGRAHGGLRHALPGGGRRLRRPHRPGAPREDRRRRHRRPDPRLRERADPAGHPDRSGRAGPRGAGHPARPGGR